MMKFKDWYTARYGMWPGVEGEPIDLVMARLANAFAENVDEAVALRLPDRGQASSMLRTGVGP